jgi:hypothetical protein
VLAEAESSLLDAQGKRALCGRKMSIRIGSGGYGKEALPAFLRGPYLCEGCAKRFSV